MAQFLYNDFGAAFKEFEIFSVSIGQRSDFSVRPEELLTFFPWLNLTNAALSCASVEALEVDLGQEATPSVLFLYYGFGVQGVWIFWFSTDKAKIPGSGVHIGV